MTQDQINEDEWIYRQQNNHDHLMKGIGEYDYGDDHEFAMMAKAEADATKGWEDWGKIMQEIYREQDSEN